MHYYCNMPGVHFHILWYLSHLYSWAKTAQNLFQKPEQQGYRNILSFFMFIGILGGFTTFSTYMLETFHLMREGEYYLALGNILLSNLLGIVLVFSGVILSERIVQYFK